MQNLSPKESKDLIKTGTAIILDIRTKEEYDDKHIQTAVNLDCHSYNFKEKLENLDKDKTYLVHCEHGVRSRAVCAMMDEMSFRDVYNMKGGLNHFHL